MTDMTDRTTAGGDKSVEALRDTIVNDYFDDGGGWPAAGGLAAALNKLIAQVASRENEACAKVAESMGDEINGEWTSEESVVCYERGVAARVIAAAIRARQQEGM